jgi:hypothetical protein
MMASVSDIVRVRLTEDEVALARRMAAAAEIGGKSNFREPGERASVLSADQFVGVGLGELACNKYFFSVDAYAQSREARNASPKDGDGGSDSPGWKIDYKTSLARKRNLLSYNLVVRPRERHDGFIYVLALVREEEIDSPTPEVNLIGWATDEMLDGRMVSDGVFAGAFVMPASRLGKIGQLKERFGALVFRMRSTA